MEPTSVPGPKQLSSGSTDFWRDISPSVFTGGFGVFLAGIWFEWFGQSIPVGAKVALTAAWAAVSVLIRLGTRTLRHVWLTDRELLVEVGGEKVPIPLEDVEEIRESRGRKLKTIRIRLRRPSPLGNEIRFVPILRGQMPFTDHPVVTEIHQRKRMLAGVSGEGTPRLT